MPPAIMTSFVPAASRSCANMAAFIPEPHILFTVVQPTEIGSPAPSAAWRAGACPCPAGSTQPMMTSCTCSGLTPARSTAARIAAAPSCGAEKSFSSPWNAPIGVRAAETKTTGSFSMAAPSCSGIAGARPARRPAEDPGRLRMARSCRTPLRHLQVAQQPVPEVVDPGVHLERLAAFPGFLHRGALDDVPHLLARIQLAQAPVARVFVGERAKLVAVLGGDVLDVAQPVVRQADAVLGHGGMHAAAAVMAAQDDVPHLEDIDGELDHREAVEVGMYHHVG